MKRRVLSLLAGLALVAAACGGAQAVEGVPAPATSFALFDGSEASLTDFRGQPVVLNFWASWCPSCVAEMSAAFRPVQERLGDEVTFVGMNIQDLRGRADDLLHETGVDWVNAEDPTGGLYQELGGLGMPFTVYIDADGQVVDRHNGPLTEQQLSDHIERLFGITA